MKDDVKIKIVAIAKDEAVYLPEWIFHHLYFGADAIDIYINRTTDNSIEILEKIQTHYPQVSFYSADWVDMLANKICGRLQYIIYSKVFYEEKKRGKYSHIFFLDIDEFWITKRFDTTLHAFVASLPEFTSVYFPWFNMSGEEKQFGYLEKNIHGKMERIGKYIVNLKSEIEIIKIHLPEFDQNNNFFGSVTPDGSPFVSQEDKPQFYDKSFKLGKYEAVVLHRMLRSEEEYIALLFRQNPEQNFSFKHNRSGFETADSFSFRVSFPSKPFEKYERSREKFFRKIKIDDELIKAKKFVFDRVEKAIDAIEDVPEENEDIMKKIFQGITNKRILSALEHYYEKVRKEKK